MTNILKPSFNSMFASNKIYKIKIKAFTESNNYIDVSYQLKAETERYKEFLKTYNPDADDNLIEDNTYTDSQVFYTCVTLMSKYGVAGPTIIRKIYRYISTTPFTQEEKGAILAIMIALLTAVLFPNLKKAKISDVKKLVKDFSDAIDVRKYDIK